MPPDPPVSALLAEVLELEKRERDLTALCDPECEGRCLVCPLEFVGDSMRLLRALATALQGPHEPEQEEDATRVDLRGDSSDSPTAMGKRGDS